MNVILIEEQAYYQLLDKVITYTKENIQHQNKWVTPTEAMKLLNIKSNTTLQSYRNEGKIRYSQPQKRVILYDRKSIDEFLERHAKEPFY
tara:strand:+ start:934 stop:1203 length:270 start_codon:yes stop_codon:yes gene_type:complete